MPTRDHTPECRWCKQRIRFLPTDGDRRMPLDPDPDPSGTIVILDGRARVLTAAELAAPPDGPRYTTHFATCPARARRGGRRRR